MIRLNLAGKACCTFLGRIWRLTITVGKRISERCGRISGTYREDSCVQGLCSKQGAHAFIFSYPANRSVQPVDAHRSESSNISAVASPRSFRCLVESPTPRVLPSGALKAVFRHRVSGSVSLCSMVSLRYALSESGKALHYFRSCFVFRSAKSGVFCFLD